MSTTALARVGSYHAVSPGPGDEDGPRYYAGRDGQPDLGSLGEAMSAAKFWSEDCGRQEVTVTRGRVTRVVRVYEHGRDITDNGTVLIPAAGPPEPAPEQVTVVDFTARRTRKPRRPSINHPPCDDGEPEQPATRTGDPE